MLGIHEEIFIALHEPITPFPSLQKWIQVLASIEATNPQRPWVPQVGSSGCEAGMRKQMSTSETSGLVTVSGPGGSEEHSQMKEASPCPPPALAVAQAAGAVCFHHIAGVCTVLEWLGAGFVCAGGTHTLCPCSSPAAPRTQAPAFGPAPLNGSEPYLLR